MSHHAGRLKTAADSSHRLSGASPGQTESTSTAIHSSHVGCRGQILHTMQLGFRAAVDSKSQAEQSFL